MHSYIAPLDGHYISLKSLALNIAAERIGVDPDDTWTCSSTPSSQASSNARKP